MPITVDQIAISGMAGRFPKCDNVEELRQALFNGVDLLTDGHDRWSYESLGTSPRLGLINDFDRFDATFFGINPREANSSDPRLRKILEVTYEAIIDAGLSPTELRGTDTGVFLAVTQNDISDLNYRGGIIARSAAIMANVVSFCFDFKGPSLAVNTACSSGFYAITSAVDSIIAGRCEIAVIGAVQHQCDPAESVELVKFGVLNIDGISRSFGADRNGYVKSEAIAALVIQGVENAKRIYATIAGIGTTVEGFKKEGYAHPSHEEQARMFNKVFTSFNLDPLDVNYVEAHCTGTTVGDVEEIMAIDNFYTKGRKTPLLVGSIKSNIGHTETTSGLISIMKPIMSAREGMIPGQLHYKGSDESFKGIVEGRLKVISKNMPIPDGLISVNSFGFGGADAMIVLRPYKERKPATNSLSHRLVVASGRTEEAVKVVLEDVIKNKSNENFLSLVDNVFSRPIDNHPYKGYAVLTEESHYQIKQLSSSKKRQVWFVFAGLGSQWPGMGKDLMKYDVFRNTIRKCAVALKPHGIDLEDVVVNSTEETFNNMVNTFTGITAVTVALVDMLKFLDVEPAGYFGHSLGEIACSYADGLITAEQAVLIAYSRSYATTSSNLPAGLMAAVGLSVEECTKLLPPDVYIACDNSDTNVTVSGPAKVIREFLNQLNARGIFNRLIANANFPLHSKHLLPAREKMLSLVKQVYPDVKRRSRKWLPSAVTESEWNTDLGLYDSAEYQAHNYVNRVQFRQLMSHVPKDSIVIEIAPRPLLGALLRRGLDSTCTLLSLSKPKCDNCDFFLSSVGELYSSGCPINLRKLYKPVSFPVSYDTPTLSNLVKWDHRTKWHALRFNPTGYYGRRIEIDMNEQSNQYLEGHLADGRLILPASGYMYYVWEAFARMKEIPLKECPVIFENFKALRPILLHKNDTTDIIVNIFRSTGNFEVCLDGDIENVLSSGNIKVAENVDKEFLDYTPVPKTNQYKIRINKDDFYNCLHLRGFDYSGLFCGVEEADVDWKSATLKWNDNWVAFLDAVTHYLLSVESTGHSLPTRYEKVVIDPRRHYRSIDENSNLELNYNKYSKSAMCGGVEIRGLQATIVKRRNQDMPPTLRKHTFIPNNDPAKEAESYRYALDIASQIVIENTTEDFNIRMAQLGSDEALQMLKTMIERVNLKSTTFEQIASIEDKSEQMFDLLVVQEITKNIVFDATRRARFVFGLLQSVDLDSIEIVYQNTTKSGIYALIRRPQNYPEKYTVITASNTNFSWFKDLKYAIRRNQNPKSRIYLINEDFNSGIVGLFNTMRLERFCPNLRVFLIRNYKETEKFSFKSQFYLDQLKKDLTVNIFQDGSWGTYRLLHLPPLEPRLCSSAFLARDNKTTRWVQKSPFSSCKEISVHYASISSYDLTYAPNEEGCLGFEYSGIDKNGNNVVGIANRKAVATSVPAHPKLTWTFPNKFSLEEAATLPLAYTLSYYGLFIQTSLSPKDSILIQNCKDDFSLASLALASNRGCTVYALVDESSKDYLKSVLPNIDNINIVYNTDSKPFYETLLKQTGGKGVNVILNCRTLDALRLSKKCLARNGRMVEIGNNSTDLLLADNIIEDCSFYNVNIQDVFEESDDILDMLKSDICKLLKEGVLIPLRYTTYDKTDIEMALKHVEDKGSKCLIKIKENGRFFSKPENRILAYPRTYIDPNKSYIVIGGLGGFGFELVRWLIERGASKVIINSRREVRSGYHAQWLQKWNNQGITVVVNTFDTTTIDGTESLVNFAANLAPVGGIFNTALHIKDDALIDQTPEHFSTVASKIYSVQNTDVVSRKLCKKLDYFVVWSSIASSIGNPHQANYAFANSAVERICETRKAEGLPGMGFQWGPLADVGILVKLKTNIQLLDTQRQKLPSCLEVVDQYLQLKQEPVVSSCVYGEPDAEAHEASSLAESVAALFGIKDVDEIDDSKSLVELGMDSLLGFEIQHILNKQAGMDVSVNDIRNMTFETIKNMS